MHFNRRATNITKKIDEGNYTKLKCKAGLSTQGRCKSLSCSESFRKIRRGSALFTFSWNRARAITSVLQARKWVAKSAL